jgi:hypothetical protein
MSLCGDPVQVRQIRCIFPLPKSVDACLLAPYATVVQRSASSAAEADRVLIDDWLIFSGFNP